MEVENLKLFDKESKRAIRRYLTRAEQIEWFPRYTESFVGALDSIFQTELRNRQYQLAIKLKKEENIKKNLREKEKKYHEQSINRIDETLKIFKSERKLIKKERLKKMDEVIKNKDAFGKVREKSIETLQNTLLESTIEPNIAMEIQKNLSDVFNKVEERGSIDGLLDYIEEQLEELKRVRSEEKDRGREQRSPLPWHKIVALALAGGGLLTVVILCLIDTAGIDHAFWVCVGIAVGETSLYFKIVAAIISWC